MNNTNTSAFKLATDSGEAYEMPNYTGSPERNLLMAILERAILDYVGNDRVEAISAEEWIFDKFTPSTQAYSFGWLCEQLDLNPIKIAAAIKAMPKRGNYRVAPWYFQKREQLCA